MNELELLERFRDDVVEPSVHEVNSARQMLLARAAEPGPRRPRSLRSGPLRHWKVVAVLAAVVMSVITLPVILGRGPGVDPAAAAVLGRFAKIARQQPTEPVPGAGQYAYSKTLEFQSFLYIPGRDLESFVLTQHRTIQQWHGADGSGREVSTPGDLSFPTTQDRAAYDAWVAAGTPKFDAGFGKSADHAYTEGQPPLRDLRNLPSDPMQLRSLIEEGKVGGGTPGGWETFAATSDLLQDTYSYAPPALRAAFYEVLASLPGVELDGNVSDPSGRPGIAVAYAHDGWKDQLIFDPRTAELLATVSTLADSSPVAGAEENPAPTEVAFARNPGDVIYSAVYLVSGEVVDSTHDAP